MVLYQFIKAEPLQRKERIPAGRKSRKKITTSFIFMGLGGAILLWAVWPIVTFALFTAPLFSSIISPVTDINPKLTGINNSLSPLVLASSGSGIGETQSDFTNANAWFPTKPQKKIVTPVNTYKLSIPKLKITDATVAISGDDLNKSLIHYGGTGLPGEYGSAIIFGHSVLPQFFNPKDYRTIFSTLPTLTIGDEIFVTYDSVDYRYVIYDMVITDPGDLSVLEQRFDDSYLTLITCVPPGTYWKRLSVKAKLTRFSS